MSVKVSGWVWDSKLPPMERLVALAYADHADHDGNNIYPSLATIARKTGLDRRSVIRIRQRLESTGVLVPTRLAENNKPARYRMAQAALASDPPSPVEAKSASDPVSPGGDPVSPQLVTPCHSTSDPVSPKPSLTVNGNRQGTGTRPARPQMQAPDAIKAAPAPGARRPGWLGPVTDDPRVTTYIALTGYTPNKLQADAIREKVTDLAKWEQTIRQRCAFGCGVTNVCGDDRSAIADYLAGGPKSFAKPAPANGKAAGKSNGRTHRLPQKTYTDAERAQKELEAASRDSDDSTLAETIARVRMQLEKQPGNQYLADYLASLLARQAQSEAANV